MRQKTKGLLSGAAIVGLCLASPLTLAQDNASRLGNGLTPMGSERAGGAGGVIPAWDGGLPRQSVDFAAGETYENPFADDQRRFVITADNLDEYRDQLTPGHIAMFEAYPDTYEMPVYPTRRSASFPDRAYEWAERNARNANLEGTDGLTGAGVTWPFPVVSRGEHPIWNHKAGYTPDSFSFFYNQAIVTSDGSHSLIRIKQDLLNVYGLEGITTEQLEEQNMQFYFLQRILSPARLSGGVLLVHESLNQARDSRQAWVYNPGQRRVRRAPNVEHDNPGTAADGLRTNDQNNVFNGSLERYDWELVGQRDLYLPYNSYDLMDTSLEPSDVIGPGHINQDLTRYELRRVYVVDATVKEGLRHLYPRRTFYVDPDSWQILAVDVYDNRGDLWRVQEGHAVNLYDVPFSAYAQETIYDLQSRRYIVLGLTNQEDQREAFNYLDFDEGADYYQPANLRRVGTR